MLRFAHVSSFSSVNSLSPTSVNRHSQNFSAWRGFLWNQAPDNVLFVWNSYVFIPIMGAKYWDQQSVCMSVCLHISHIAHNADQSGDTRILSGTIWRSAAYSHSHSSVPTRSRTVAFDVSDSHRSFWGSTQVASLQRKSPGRQQHQDGMAVWSMQQSLLIQNNGLFAHRHTHRWSSPSYSTEQSMWISQKPHNIKISIKIFLYPLLMAMQYIMWMTSCCDVTEWQGWN